MKTRPQDLAATKLVEFWRRPGVSNGVSDVLWIASDGQTSESYQDNAGTALLIRNAVQTLGADMALELNVLTRSAVGEDAAHAVASRAALSGRESLANTQARRLVLSDLDKRHGKLDAIPLGITASGLRASSGNWKKYNPKEAGERG